MKNSNFTIVVLFVLFCTEIIGQNENKSYVKTDLNYISDAIFMGRKDSIAAPYLYPSITYHHKSGLYANGSFSYLTKSNESRIDLYLLTAGFDFTKKKLTGDFSLTKYFFNDKSYNVISEVTVDVSANLSYDFDILNLSVAASNYFSSSDNSDFFLSSEISHDFLTNNYKFQFSPTIGVHFGSQNFYEEYYVTKHIRRHSENGSGTGGTTETVTESFIEESVNFNLMAVELSLPMWYSENSLTFLFLPALVFPQSEATILDDESIIKEKLDDVFYWMIGVSYKFD